MINPAKDRAEVKSRKDAMFLAQVRSGHCLSFKAYHHLLNSAVDPICPRCGKGPHTLKHWFMECAGTKSTRRDICGEVSPSLEVLTDQSVKGSADVTAHPVGQPSVSIPDLRQQRQQQGGHHLIHAGPLQLNQ